MAAAENVRCNLSVEEEIHGEWMLDSTSDMSVIILNSMLAWFLFNRFEESSMYSSENNTTRHWYSIYKILLRNRTKKRGKNYMNLTCVQNLLSIWFALSVDDSCDWLSATTTLPMGQILLKSFSRYRRFFMRWTLFWDVVKLFPPYSL